MDFANIAEGLKELTEVAALEVLASKIPLESLEELNEPVDRHESAGA